MKHPSRMAGLVLCLTGFVAIAGAQDRVIARVNIPFPFAAHAQTLDAGAYELRQIGAQTVRLQLPDSRIGVTLLSSQSIGAGDPVKLSFRVLGDRYFLSAITAPSFHIALPKSRSETEIAELGTKTRTVDVVGRR